MFDRPSAAELLDIARRVLREELLDALPSRARYPASMVANAMAIAQRDIEAAREGGEPPAALVELLGAAAERDLQVLMSALAGAVRRRELDPGDARLRALLLQQTIAALRISNPRYLAAYGLE